MGGRPNPMSAVHKNESQPIDASSPTTLVRCTSLDHVRRGNFLKRKKEIKGIAESKNRYYRSSLDLIAAPLLASRTLAW